VTLPIIHPSITIHASQSHNAQYSLHIRIALKS
jgi:hypothetical protein